MLLIQDNGGFLVQGSQCFIDTLPCDLSRCRHFARCCVEYSLNELDTPLVQSLLESETDGLGIYLAFGLLLLKPGNHMLKVQNGKPHQRDDAQHDQTREN